MNYVNTYLFTWDQRGGFGLGQSSLFPPYLPTYLLAYLWSLLGLPLWIVNRLWFILPNILIGFGAFYLYQSLFNSRYSWICGTISSIFIMLLPEKFSIPVLEIGFAGTLFAIGSVIRGLFVNGVTNSKNHRIIIVFGFAILLASQGFRYFYISIVILLVITISSLYYHRKEKQRLINNFKFLSRCTALALLLNLFWIIPLYLLLTGPKELITSTPEVLESRLAFNTEHQRMTSPLYVLRASTGGEGLGRPPYYYFSYPLIVPFSFIIPLYCFLPLLLNNINIKIKLLIYGIIPLTLFVVSFHFSPTINMFLREYVPLFWPLGNPQYWLCYVGVFYGLIVGSTTEHFLFLIAHEGNKPIKKVTFNPKILKFILAGCVGLIVIVFGGGILLDKPLIKGFHTPYFLYGNKLPYIKIPEEYDKVEKYLTNNAKVEERIWYIGTGNYKKYTWSQQGHQPELLFFKSPIPAVGQPLSWAAPIIDLLSTSIDYRKKTFDNGLKLASFLNRITNIKYILIHKDYLFEEDRRLNQSVEKELKKNTIWKVVMDNKEFSLYENADCCPGLIYASGSLSNYSMPVGSTELLVPLSDIPYFNTNPTIVSINPQNPYMLWLLRNNQIHNQLLFANRNFNDFVIDLAEVESKAKGDWREAKGDWREAGGKGLTSQKPILVKLNKNGKGKFKVKDSGVYEVWVKNTENLARFKDWGLEVDIDGEELEGWEGREGDKWIKVGEKELEEFHWFNWFDWLIGKHKIEVKSQEIAGRTLSKEEFKKMGRDLEFVIVSKDKMKEYEDLLKSKDIGYLFYVDKEKIENMIKDEERLKEIKLKKDNPFRIGEQNFYIPKDGSYSVKALVKPKRDFLEEGFVSSSSSSSIRTSLDALSGWDVKALNTTYKQSIAEDGLYIDAYFQDKGDEKESIVLTKRFSADKIRIKERPYLAFSTEMEDLGVQEIEIDVKLTDESEWFSLFRRKKIRLKADNKQYVINMYQRAKDIFGRETARNLSISEIILKFKKRDGVDLSREKDRHIYPFKFKAIGFSKTPPILTDFKDRLFAYLPDNYHYFDVNGDLRRVDFPEQIPLDVKDVYRLHLNRFIDLKETPVLSLNFPKPSIEDWRKEWMFEDGEWRTEFPQEWKVVLGIDFDGDEKEDERVELFVPAAGMSGGDLLLAVRAYEEVKKRFPDKQTPDRSIRGQDYNLLSIGVSHPDDKEITYQTVMSKKLIRYRERVAGYGLRVDADVLEIDGKTYKLEAQGKRLKAKSKGQEAKGDRQKVKDEENNWVEFNDIYLKAGEHSLNVFENGSFKVEMVEVKPEARSQESGVRSQEPPKVEFKKINPTRYIVDVKGAKEPFTLVFSESFHEGWKAYVRKSGVRSQESGEKTIPDKQLTDNEPWSALWSAWMDSENRIEIKDHFVVNGYANGWIVPVEQFRVSGSEFRVQDNNWENFEIVLEYKPQRLFEVGLLISTTTLLGCIGYLGYGWRRGRKGLE